jgi:hypothetical protein
MEHLLLEKLCIATMEVFHLLMVSVEILPLTKMYISTQGSMNMDKFSLPVNIYFEKGPEHQPGHICDDTSTVSCLPDVSISLVDY